MAQTTTSSPLARILAAVIGLGIFGAAVLFLYPSAHGNGGIGLALDADGVRARGAEIVRGLGLDPEGFDLSLSMTNDNAVLERMYARHSGARANALLRERVPGHFWKLRFLRRENEETDIAAASGDQAEIIRRLITGDVLLHLDGNGRLLRVQIPLKDSSAASPGDAEAYDTARRLLLAWVPAVYLGPVVRRGQLGDSASAARAGITHRRTEAPERVDHEFRWTVRDEVLADSIDLRVVLRGGTLTDFEAVPRFTRNFKAEQTTEFSDVLEAAYYIVFGIILLVVFFRRIRSYEIGFRTAMVMGAGIALLFGVWLFFELETRSLEILIPLLIAPLFVGGGFIPVWAVGETLGRETWKEKLLSFDLLRSGQPLHSRVGSAMLHGSLAGTAMLAAGLLAAWLLDGFGTTWIRQDGGDGIRLFSTPFPAAYAFGNALIMGLYATAFMLLSIVSLLRQRLRSKALVVAVPALLFTAVNGINLVPLPLAWLVLLPGMLLLVWLFVETDLLTALAALVVFGILNDGVIFFLPGNAAWSTEAMQVAGVLAAIPIWGIVAMLVPDRVTDYDSITPRFQRHITERQRLTRELEIARDVQMGFLPKRNPSMPGLDIASHCAPALEVGGDYYDFIDLGGGRLGIAIGDVSGKGTQAAFYMTLAKGFLQALAFQHPSPADVLVEMNRLFYRNVDRGHFISMIYAVFDMETRELCIARAGHAPVMRRSAGAAVDVIHSRGIALGFESGSTFSATIEEARVPLNTGDTFVLYTDGYPEAMTRTREEYGEERLAAALQRFEGTSAEELLGHLHRDTLRFAGRAEQHDDMTMVVVRVS
ncbi:MAG: PP2C family protein-serine/threonine phosphatase [Bacteroidetes bacterium]|nr:PP2C family protein-serine/threonine phosphatase [Bacteroidota bacterium]